MNISSRHHYRLNVRDKKRRSLEQVINGAYCVASCFKKPVTDRLPKIYIVKQKGEIVYVGITSQSISSRLCYGFAARKNGGGVSP